jgi:hypothetical protein
MPLINFVTGELLFRIAFVGPAFSGRAAALRCIQTRLGNCTPGKIEERQAGADRLQAFDFLLLDPPANLPAKPRFELSALQGPLLNPTVLDRMLADIDGIAFVADSRWDKMEANATTLKAVATSLRKDGTRIEETPLVLLYNQRDIPGTVPTDYLDFLLNNGPIRRPAFVTSTSSGKNVFTAVDTLLKIVLAKQA